MVKTDIVLVKNYDGMSQVFRTLRVIVGLRVEPDYRGGEGKLVSEGSFLTFLCYDWGEGRTKVKKELKSSGAKV
jgi:hypothetical protein